MRYNLDIRGFKELQADLADVMARADTSLARTLNFVAQSTAQRAKNKIRTGKRTGHVYEIDGRMHQASAPGEPPADLSGALADSIHFVKMSERLDGAATAGTDLHYGETLEFGGFSTFNGRAVYVDARPFLLPSFEEAIVGVEQRLKNEFERGSK